MKNYISLLMIIIVATIMTFSLGHCAGYNKAKDEYKNNTKTVVDSISKANSELKFQVKQLDSFKNEKVIEVKGLSNDSTLNLFKRLTSTE